MECKSIDITRATIVSTTGHPADPEPTTVLTISAPLTVALAESLRCKDMAFTLNDNARNFDGKFGLPLELGDEDADIILPNVNGSRDTLRPHRIWKFRVGHETDLQLAVEFRAHFKGEADSQIIGDLLQFVNQNPFTLSIVSTQGELFAEKAEATNDGKRVNMSGGDGESEDGQESLGLEAVNPAKPAKEKSGCKHCDAGIPTETNDDAIHVNGQTCAVWDKPLIPEKPMETATLHSPTASERKKARLAEEEKKREAKAAPTVWPVPNEFGVYRDEEATDLLFEGKKCAAQIQVLQIGPDQWIAAVHASTGTSSYGCGLSAHVIYPTKEIAIAREAYTAAERAEQSAGSGLSNPTDKKQWSSIHAWFVERYGDNHEAATATDAEYWQRNYRAVPEMAEASA